MLEENHSDHFLKDLAIKWLGIIACKIKTGYNRLAGENKTYTPEWISELNDALPIKVDMDTSITSISLLDQCRKKILDNTIEERISTSVPQFYLCNWGFVESVLWTKANKGWELEEKKNVTKIAPTTTEEENAGDREEEDDLDGDRVMVDTTAKKTYDDEVRWPKETALLLGETCKYYWLTCLGIQHSCPKPSVSYEFPEMSRADYMLLAELLASRQTLYTSFNFILSEILTCVEKDAVVYRSNALKAIGKIASDVPEIMDEVYVYKLYCL